MTEILYRLRLIDYLESQMLVFDHQNQEAKNQYPNYIDVRRIYKGFSGCERIVMKGDDIFVCAASL